MRGDWSPPVKSVADKFMVFTHCLSGFWLVGIGFSAHLHFLVWVVWLFCGCLGLSGVSSWFTVSCVVFEALLCMLRGLVDDETSSHYIFLFVLLLVPFHLMGLSIKALLYIFIAWGLQKYWF